MDFTDFSLNVVPDIALKDVCILLDEKTPCSFKALINLLQQNNCPLFSFEEYENFKKQDSQNLLKNIAAKGQTIGFLYHYLSLLPCDCTTNALSKAIKNYHHIFNYNFKTQSPESSRQPISNPNNSSYFNQAFPPEFQNPNTQNFSNNYTQPILGKVNYNPQVVQNPQPYQREIHPYPTPNPNNLQNYPPIRHEMNTDMIQTNGLQYQQLFPFNNLAINENSSFSQKIKETHFNSQTKQHIGQQNGLQNTQQNGVYNNSLTNNPNCYQGQTTAQVHTQSHPNNSQTYSRPMTSLSQQVSIDQNLGEIIITTQPKNCCLTEGDILTLTCNARLRENQNTQLMYQWFKEDTEMVNGMIRTVSSPISKVLDNDKFMNEIGTQDQGLYYCVVSENENQKIESNKVYVSIVPKELSALEYYATDKVALIIGNSEYHNIHPLPAAVNDVKKLAKILQVDLKFKVFSLINLTFFEMHHAFQLFKDFVEKGCYCVFYFAGHGFQNGNQFYLVPVDAGVGFPVKDCIDAKRELQIFQRDRNPDLLLIMLDMCRKKNTKDKDFSFSNASFTDNVVLCFSTNENSFAYENNDMGIFAASLSKYLSKPIRVTHMLEETQEDIKKQHFSIQLCEIRNLMPENRSLCNHLQPGPNYAQLTEDYKKLTVYNSVAFEFTACKAYAQLIVKPVLTNVVSAIVQLNDSGTASEGCEVYIKSKELREKGLKLKILEHLEGYNPDFSTHIEITNLQILKTLEIPVRLIYILNGEKKMKTQKYPISLGLAEKWGASKNSRYEN